MDRTWDGLCLANRVQQSSHAPMNRCDPAPDKGEPRRGLGVLDASGGRQCALQSLHPAKVAGVQRCLKPLCFIAFFECGAQ